jgi:nucleotide-binding universal stress UspA family protein
MATQAVIVFPTDFSGSSLAALPWAKRMAASLGARIDCIYVVEEPQVYATLDMGPVPIPSTDDLVASARARLADFVAKHFAGQAPAPAQQVLVGRPADEVVGYARDQAAQLIIMATHGYSGVKHVLLGSTTESVLRHASCPVLSIRAGA